MSDYGCVWIRIGGVLRRKQVAVFLEAVRMQDVSLEWGDAPFAPASAEDLLGARRDQRLCLCDDRARDAAFPALETTCRTLRLSFTRHSESGCNFDAELVDWRPGMRRPLVRIGSNVHPSETYVPAHEVTRVLRYLEARRTAWALAELRKFCPAVTEVPPLVVR